MGHAAGLRGQGHRRRDLRDSEPLARARHHLGLPGRQACLRRKAGLLGSVGRAADGERGPQKQCPGPGRVPEPVQAHDEGGHEAPAQRQAREDLHGPRTLLQAARRHRALPGRPDGRRRKVHPDERRGPDALLHSRRTWTRSTTISGSGLRANSRSTATASITTGIGSGNTATATPATRARTSSTSPAGASTKTTTP